MDFREFIAISEGSARNSWNERGFSMRSGLLWIGRGIQSYTNLLMLCALPTKMAFTTEKALSAY
jgi:hypothetical protein